MTEEEAMTRLARLASTERHLRHLWYPGEWKRMYYKKGQGTKDAICWVGEIRKGRRTQVVRSVCTPGEADTLVKEHNAQRAGANDD